MGEYVCQFGVSHGRCRCTKQHPPVACNVPEKHAPEPEHVAGFEGEIGVSEMKDDKMTTFVGGEEIVTELPEPDKINPDHYKASTSGVECIEITEHLSFTLGNAIKYMWRVGLKDDVLTELKKARWYLEREYALRPTLGWVAFPSAPDFEDWSSKFGKHIESLTDDNLQQALTFCLSSVSPSQKRKDLLYALDYLEEAIKLEEQKLKKK